MSKTKVLICPYCGDTQSAGERCKNCGGLFEALSRQATHNAMGPWFVRDDQRPFQPGASYETIIRLIERKLVNKYSIIRGPTTKQFWTVAKRVPGIAHLLGYCHNCDASVDPGDHGCHSCGVPFGAYMDRNFLGLPDVRPLPWEASADAQPSPTMPHRAMDFRRAAEPLGISSFASDEELRGIGMAPMSSFAHEPHGSGSSVAIDSPGPGVSSQVAPMPQPSHHQSVRIGTPANEPGESIIAARALQRRLSQQQRTIRLLVGGMCLLALLVVVSLAALIASRRGAAAVVEKPNSAAQPTTAPVPTAPEQSASAPATQSQPPAIEEVEPEPPPVIEAEPEAAQETAVSEAQYLRAQELISFAERQDRPRAERIQDYEDALEILKRIEKAAWAEDRVDIAEQIAHVEHEIERLRLEEYFP